VSGRFETGDGPPSQLNLGFQDDCWDDIAAFDRLAVTPANQAAISALSDNSAWPRPQLCVQGAPKSGLTRLARAWVARENGWYFDVSGFHECSSETIDAVSGGVVALDGPERVEDGAKLRALMTQVGKGGGRLLLLANHVPAAWPFTQSDLVSRIRALPVIEIGPPDAEMMRLRLARGLSRFYHRLPDDVAAYLLVRLPRSYERIEQCVAQLAAAAQGSVRGITVPLAREVLDRETGIDQTGTENDTSQSDTGET